MGDSNDSNENKSERRKAERVPINREFGQLGEDKTTWVSDLSEGGVFVHSRDRLPVGSTIELRFTVLLDDPVLIEAVGTVVRHSEHPRGMGVAFAAVSEAMALRIQDVLARPRGAGAPSRKSSLAAPLAPLEAGGFAARSLTREQFEHATTGAYPRVGSPAPVTTPDPLDDDEEDEHTRVFTVPNVDSLRGPANAASSSAAAKVVSPPKVSAPAVEKVVSPPKVSPPAVEKVVNPPTAQKASPPRFAPPPPSVGRRSGGTDD